MSGHKHATVSVDYETYEHIHALNVDLEYQSRETAHRMEEVRTQLQDLSHHSLQNIYDRQGMYEEMLRSFDERTRQYEEERSRSISEQEEKYHRWIVESNLDSKHYLEQLLNSQMNSVETALQTWNKNNEFRLESSEQFQQSQTNQMRMDTIRWLETLNRKIEGNFEDAETRIHSKLAELDHKYSSQLDELLETSKRMLITEREKKTFVLQSIRDAEKIFRFIQDQYDVELFGSEKLRTIEKLIEKARENFHQGFIETALSDAQQSYRQASDLRHWLELETNRRIVLQETVFGKIQQLLAVTEDYSFVPGIDLDGNLLPETIDTQVWSDGAYSALVDQVVEMEAKLSVSWNKILPDVLQNMLDVDIPAMEEKLKVTIKQAQINALNAHLRINIAEVVVNQLMCQGYNRIEESFYEPDQSGDYLVKLASMAGAQVQVRVSPNLNEFGNNEVHIYSADGEPRYAHEMRQRFREISRQLNEFGLAVTQMKEETTGSQQRIGIPIRNSRRRINGSAVSNSGK